MSEGGLVHLRHARLCSTWRRDTQGSAQPGPGLSGADQMGRRLAALVEGRPPWPPAGALAAAESWIKRVCTANLLAAVAEHLEGGHDR